MSKQKILIVDDDEDIRSQMKWALADTFDVVLGGTREDALATMREAKPEVVLLDLGLPPQPASTEVGLQALQEILEEQPATKVIVITGQSEKENALEAVGSGAYDFLAKPIDTEELKVILKRAFYVANLEREYRGMQRQLHADHFEGMIGPSGAMQAVFTQIRKVATTDAPVLVLGESGTGKEMTARAVHAISPRMEGPFTAINCGGIPDNLLESELFGHEKGAFTGAHVQRQGRIELAEGGTLFLDEIGEMPAQLQVKLLRFLQEHKFERIGGRKELEVDVRIIAATNQDLKEAIDDGRFREDLYYRLAVVVMEMPPLRERPGDIQVLGKTFLQQYAAEFQKDVQTFSADGKEAMARYEWPGNVRELDNRVKRAVIMAEGKRVTAHDLELVDLEGVTGVVKLKDAREALEKRLIENALARHGGNISRAAADLGVSRPTLYEMMDKLGMDRSKPET